MKNIWFGKSNFVSNSLQNLTDYENIILPYLGKPKFQIQRGEDSELGKGFTSTGQACGYSEPTHGLPA